MTLNYDKMIEVMAEAIYNVNHGVMGREFEELIELSPGYVEEYMAQARAVLKALQDELPDISCPAPYDHRDPLVKTARVYNELKNLKKE